VDGTFGAVLRAIRTGERKLSLRGLGQLVGYSGGYIHDLEQGRRPPNADLARRLDVALDSGKRLYELVAQLQPDDQECGVRSHKFLPAYVGPDAVQRLAEGLGACDAESQWLDCRVVPVERPDGASCELWLWPFGVAVYHLAEDRSWPDLTTLARWRYDTYPQDMQWASGHLSAAGEVRANVDYALSAYWVHTPTWRGDQLDTALRMLSMPRILTGGAAGDVEAHLLSNGWTHPEIQPFGVEGVSIGYASWAGVVYHPLCLERALGEERLVACELAVQAVWEYAAWIAKQVEAGKDPAVPDSYGWRWLRGVQSRLGTPRPQETGAHRSMREAIVRTSTLDQMLASSIDTMRDVA